MNYRNQISRIFSLILALSIWVISASTAWADESINVQVTSEPSKVAIDNKEIVESADELTNLVDDQLSSVVGTYISLGSTYRDSGDYKKAEESYQTAVELAKASKNLDAELFANAGLIEIKLLSGEIDEAQKSAIIKQLKTDYTTAGGTLFARGGSCPVTCPIGGPAYKRYGVTVCC